METIIFKSTQIGELIDADEKSGIVKGYGSIFGNVDSDGDVINKGAYKKTINETIISNVFSFQLQILGQTKLTRLS